MAKLLWEWNQDSHLRSWFVASWLSVGTTRAVPHSSTNHSSTDRIVVISYNNASVANSQFEYKRQSTETVMSRVFLDKLLRKNIWFPKSICHLDKMYLDFQ